MSSVLLRGFWAWVQPLALLAAGAFTRGVISLSFLMFWRQGPCGLGCLPVYYDLELPVLTRVTLGVPHQVSDFGFS